MGVKEDNLLHTYPSCWRPCFLARCWQQIHVCSQSAADAACHGRRTYNVEESLSLDVA